MNKTDIRTDDKVSLTLRIAPETYNKLINKVYSKKEKLRGFSINQYLRELLIKDLGKK